MITIVMVGWHGDQDVMGSYDWLNKPTVIWMVKHEKMVTKCPHIEQLNPLIWGDDEDALVNNETGNN